ncbi:MAG TPA: GAF and ANTAR domain-containing protein [Mycobacterium sp.]|jgi:GAF domain-containing protein|nr:GAF and ANTAR domain-containing protein [Mycobacterium sp.]
MANVVEPVRIAELLSRLAHADLAGDLADELEPQALIDRVLRRAIGLVPGAQEAGITVLPHSGRAGPDHFATGSLVDAGTALEDQVGEGPGHDAAEGPRTIRVDDLAADRRWPHYAPQASGLGLCSILVTALPCTHGPRGTLIVCSQERAAFGPAAEQILPNVANRIAIAVAHADMLRHMRRAIDSRTVIGQACGILIERHKIPAEQAFKMLVRASQRNHLKLRDLAGRLVETGEEPDAIRY